MSERKTQARKRAEDRVLQIVTGAGRQSTRQNANLPDPYRQLLSEASDPSRLEGPPAKRRRVGGGTRPNPVVITDDSDTAADLAGDTFANPQTIVDSDQSDESDFEWEDTGVAEAVPTSGDDAASIGDVAIEVINGITTPRRIRRKGQTAADRKLALATHQAHFLFLLFHAHIRNTWCNLSGVETQLRRVLSAKIISLLNPDPAWVQLRQSDSFLEGLRSALDVWRAKFKVATSGMRKAYWRDTPDEIDELRTHILEDTESLDKAEFVQRAKTMRGSHDLGSQLFCALLRAVGVEARLVCSLQVLPLTMSGQSNAVTTPRSQKPQKPRIYATFESEHDSTSAEEVPAHSTRGIRGVRRRLGQPSLGAPVGSYDRKPETPKRKPAQQLDYPIFWVEVLNPAYQKWLPVDVVVTGNIGRPSKLEPPASYALNNMSYVIAFEENGTAIDVTRRYAKAYNAKTRRLRVESTKDGQRWLRSAMKPFRRRMASDRDQIEEAELSKKEAQEGLPSSIQDFKDHPVYALERHLKRNEIIWPKREVGKVNAGKSSASKLESVYRRSDVQVVHSADKWYRNGREIKSREQPMKHVPARSRQARSPSEDGDEEPASTAMYAYSQTELFIPPPVIRGKVPKNIYGNIDIYVPSMVPPGGVHIKHALSKKAAQLLGVDFADAVTGFQFKGRHGTAIVQGIVVALENKEAVESVITGFQDTMRQDEDDERSLESLRLWRRFLLGLQIADRIGLTDIYAANDEQQQKFKEELDEAEDQQEEVFESGGFFPDAGADEVVQPTGHLFKAAPEPPSTAVGRSRDTEHVTKKQEAQIQTTKSMTQLESDEEPIYDPRSPIYAHSPQAHVASPVAAIPSNEAEDIVPMEDSPVGGAPGYQSDTGGGFMVEDAETTPPAGIATTATINSTDEPHSLKDDMQVANEAAEALDPAMEVMSSASSSAIEQGSLLSHDPEDEDAEPDWLEP